MENIILVSALIPVSIEEENGEYKAKVSPGGLITTLSQSIKGKSVKWFGWYGFEKFSKHIEELIIEEGKKKGLNLFPISLSKEEIYNFFNMFSNGVIWPLFHSFTQYCRFNEDYWHFYKKANEKFARKILKHIDKDTVLWVHDYHFFLLPKYIKEKNKNVKINFFLHIPFPSPEIFLKLPWRKEIIDGFLNFDFAGFHTQIDKENFINCVKHFYNVKEEKADYFTDIYIQGKKIRLASIPISIDFNFYDKSARKKETVKIFKDLKEKYKDKHLIISVDRIDYTKGLVEKLNGYRRFLEKYPEYREKVVLMISTAPNVKKLPEYENLEKEFHHKIAEINGSLGTENWRPVLFINRRLSLEELTAYYRTADISLITPIKDGLNIVCKEYAASNVDLNGAVILSEFAGASTEIGDFVYLVNPNDIENIADTIKKVIEEKQEIKKEKMENLRKHINKFNIYWWAETYFKIAEGKNINNFPKIYKNYPLHEVW